MRAPGLCTALGRRVARRQAAGSCASIVSLSSQAVRGLAAAATCMAATALEHARHRSKRATRKGVAFIGTCPDCGRHLAGTGTAATLGHARHRSACPLYTTNPSDVLPRDKSWITMHA